MSHDTSTESPATEGEAELVQRELDRMARELNSYSTQMNAQSTAVLISTSLNILIIVALYFIVNAPSTFAYVLMTASVIVLITIMSIIFSREMLRRRSIALFDEATTMLQIVNDMGRRSQKRFIEQSRFREATRTYSLSMDYPIFSGPLGGAMLSVLNILFFAVIVVRFWLR